MIIAERIGELLKLYGLNKHQFANKIEVSSTIIYNIIGGRKSNPSYELINKILDAFPDLSAEWLLRGKGDYKIDESSERNVLSSALKPCKECEKKDKMIDRLERENDRLLKFIDKIEGDNKRKDANCG
ncbi:MAG: helix-turn-helix transcriptional regulator [Marinilabiliaceae bacterium]|nr:helix-turn-helix transcriptional regulator [Marinilabiliaceae bacterium]